MAERKGEPMDDLISRQAAIDATWFEPSYTDPLNVLTEVRDRLKALPSAQPEQQIPQMRGWVCPVCGRGLSPYTSVCPCNNGKGWEITC